MEQPDLLSDLLELLKATLFLATCVDCHASQVSSEVDIRTDMGGSLEDQGRLLDGVKLVSTLLTLLYVGTGKGASNVNAICEFIFVRLKSHLAIVESNQNAAQQMVYLYLYL